MILINFGCSSPNSPVNGNWISLGLNGKGIYRIKTTQNYVYACALQSGLFRQSISSYSTQWEYLGLQSQSQYIGGITDVVVNPNNENEFIASRSVNRSNLPGIFKSLDAGKTWVESDSGFGFNVPWWYPADSGKLTSGSVLFNPANQFDIIYAGSDDCDGIYMSTNSGLTWSTIINPNLNVFSQVVSFSQEPSNQNIIYVGGSSGDWGNTLRPAWLIKSANGITGIWNSLLPTPTDQIYFNNIVSNICITSNPNVIYIGMRGFVLGSKDGGKTWDKLIEDSNHPNDIFSIAVAPKDTKHLIAANWITFLESFNEGKTWFKINIPNSGKVCRLHWDKRTDNLYAISSDSNSIYVLPNASSTHLKDLH
jgi:hypothetical protein